MIPSDRSRNLIHTVTLGAFLALMPAASQAGDANPCAAKTLNPCAAKTLNPCAAKTLNPCAAKTLNPCAAKTLNPCAAKTLNPCAAKTLNPCAAKTLNPCRGANPCNPCGANPCNPCGGGASVDPARFAQPEGESLAGGNRAQLVAEGAKLWKDGSLSTNGASCSTCHVQNYAQMQPTFAKPYPHRVMMVEQMSGVPRVSAAEMVQFCMLQPMQAEPLPWSSPKLAALAAFVEHIRPGYEPVAGGAPNPCNPCARRNVCNPCGVNANPCNPCGMKPNPCGGS
jgi:hypothetical protein